MIANLLQLGPATKKTSEPRVPQEDEYSQAEHPEQTGQLEIPARPPERRSESDGMLMST